MGNELSCNSLKYSFSAIAVARACVLSKLADAENNCEIAICLVERGSFQPEANEYASTPGKRKSVSKVRSGMDFDQGISWYILGSMTLPWLQWGTGFFCGF
jgi:hypothetical protein